MRLRRVYVSTSAAGRKYYRWDVSVPPRALAALGWKVGQELEARVENGRLVFSPARPRKRPERL